MTTIKQLAAKGKQLADRVANFGAPFGNKNAAGAHKRRGAVTGKSPAEELLHPTPDRLRFAPDRPRKARQIGESIAGWKERLKLWAQRAPRKPFSK